MKLVLLGTFGGSAYKNGERGICVHVSRSVVTPPVLLVLRFWKVLYRPLCNDFGRFVEYERGWVKHSCDVCHSGFHHD